MSQHLILTRTTKSLSVNPIHHVVDPTVSLCEIKAERNATTKNGVLLRWWKRGKTPAATASWRSCPQRWLNAIKHSGWWKGSFLKFFQKSVCSMVTDKITEQASLEIFGTELILAPKTVTVYINNGRMVECWQNGNIVAGPENLTHSCQCLAV